MISSPTVFILGAGASYPYGFPTGAELRDEICTRFKDEYLSHFYHYYERDEIPYERVKKEVNDFVSNFKGSALSIDAFISTNYEIRSFYSLGKAAICQCLLNKEIESRQSDHVIFRKNWFSELFNKMIAGLHKKDRYVDFAKNDVTFITFNYERSFEYLLSETLMNAYARVPFDEIIPVLKEIPIYHVYGQLAKLNWQVTEEDDQPDYLNYGEEVTFKNILHCTPNILTIYDEHGKNNNDFISEKIRNAKRIFFLGFGYQRENIEALGLTKGIINRDTYIYGTALGESEYQINNIRRMLWNCYSRENRVLGSLSKIIILNMDCQKLIHDYL